MDAYLGKKLLNKLKTEISDAFGEIKAKTKEETWFLLSIAVLTILFVASMFAEPLIYVVSVFIISLSIIFDFEHNICLLLFCYTFDSIFHVNLFGSNFNLITIVYSFIVFACGTKYLISVCKKKEKINISLLTPLILFLIYILIPVHKIRIYDSLKFITAVAMFYLLIVSKKKVNIKKVVFYASVGLILASFVSLLAPLASRMPAILGYYTNLGRAKFEGLFVNPNIFAIFSALILVFICYYCLQEKNYFWFLLLIPISIFAYMTLSRDYLICLVIMIICYSIIVIIKRNKRSAISFLFILLTFITVGLSQFNNTKVYLIRFNIIPYGSVEVKKTPPSILSENKETNDDNTDQEIWIDGTAKDPGRIGIWKRYLKDFVSSPDKIIFGSGISAEELGMGPHNFYLQFIWQFGILGFVIAIFAFLRVLVKLFKNFKSSSTNVLVAMVLFIWCVESLFFDLTFVTALILFIISSEGEYESISNRASLQSRTISK